jgi:hypothetical protein
MWFLFEPIMTGYDQFFAVFICFSSVVWLFPFMVNWSVIMMVFPKIAEKLDWTRP